MFKRKKGFVSIWVGQGVTKKQFQSYAVDEDDSEDDDVPLNGFAKDAGDTFYDHDFIEAEWLGAKPKALGAALGGFSHADSFLDAVLKLGKKKGIDTANALVLLYDTALSPARWPKGSPLVYLGTVPYEPVKPKAQPPKPGKDDHQGEVYSAQISPDGSVAITRGYKDTMHVWDLKAGKLIAKKKTPQLFHSWLPSGKEFLTELTYPEKDEGFAAWAISANDVVKKKTYKTKQSVRAVQSIDGKSLVWVGQKPCVGDLAKWGSPDVPKSKKVITSVHAFADGRIVSIDIDGNFAVWDLDAGKAVKKFKVAGSNQSVLGEFNEQQLVVLAPTSKDNLLLVDVEKGKAVHKLKKSKRLDHWCVNDGKLFGMGGSTVQAELCVWSLKSGQRALTVTLDEINVVGAFSADGQRAATASYHGNVHLFDVEKSKKLATWRVAPDQREVEYDIEDGDGYELTSVAISNDGKTVVAGEASGRVFILRYERGKLKQVR
jgi:WD40 repeat protein